MVSIYFRIGVGIKDMRHETRAMDLDMKGGRWQVTVKSLHFVALIETLDERQGGHVVPNERAGILEGGSRSSEPT